MDECCWIYRPGTNGSHWAYTVCRPGFNYLSKLPSGSPYVGVADFYNGKLCPICWRKIRMDYREVSK